MEEISFKAFMKDRGKKRERRSVVSRGNTHVGWQLVPKKRCCEGVSDKKRRRVGWTNQRNRRGRSGINFVLYREKTSQVRRLVRL